ncbi:hypothetical protein [Actinoplanes sp. NPDC026670]|jgi:hypothetical protein|uniref:hypothetical protein n=1 Tax=Actinoplanes sp. NPDC026670 TaxID=3154700 RepID=UPI0033C2F19C
MLTAESTSFWGKTYTIAENGTPITTWDNSWWKSGGTFELGGRAYHVRANMWGSRYTMLDAAGAVFAEAERVGRKNWTVHAGGRAYEFRRTSIFRSDQNLMDGERTIGTIRRTSSLTGNLAAELPGLPLPLQVFVLGVLIVQWQSTNAAGAA